MHYLVVSPTPIAPATAGNRSLILAMVRRIRKAGHRVSFLYSTQEIPLAADDPETRKEVDALYISEFDQSLYEKANEAALKRAQEDEIELNYTIDAWYDEKIGELARTIYAHDPFDVMLGNYIWNSKTFESIPAAVIKIQQTHDKMSNRMAMLARQGLPPAWFSVSPADEANGLGRADINIALQQGEELFFRSLTNKAVYTVQHAVDEKPFAPLKIPAGRKLRVGFIGGDNSINVRTIVTLIELLDNMPAVSNHIELHIAGPVCRIFVATPPFAKLIGLCDDLDAFYESIDVIVNPVAEGTGLKIKSVEALQRHIPILMTKSGSDGLLSPYHFHRCNSAKEVLGYLKMIADNPSLLSIMQTAGRQVLQSYCQRLEDAYGVLTQPKEILAEREALKSTAQKIMLNGIDLLIYETSPEDIDKASKASEILRNQIPTGGVLVDTSSRCGTFAVFAANTCKASKVIALEFAPEYLDRIKLNVIENKRHNTIDLSLLGYAAGEAPGYGELVEGKNRRFASLREDGIHTEAQAIPIAPLDQLLADAERLDALIMETDNAVTVLNGAQAILNKFRPAIFIKNTIDCGEALRELLAKIGYTSNTSQSEYELFNHSSNDNKGRISPE